ncbi:AAA family ATPase [Microbacterium aurantiacum]|uniref:AAA family ATPase n=1 Tax=Microbacterium aurantiacum TaxID=162393 RepID=UPI000C7FB1FF|nr:AAA family ATPase [Microbacterium aurantiacum]
MRLHRLEIEGFGPFRSRQFVDFDAFADDGIFLIAGRTGAGKSSILDAVCFGLYGGVPRYESGDKRLRSDHCEPDDISEVVVEFSTTGGRFRVTRSPEYLRTAKRGGGLTKQAQAVALEERTDAGWIGRAARAVDVGNELDTILQLSREQFLQVILLAQNRFSEFLLANSKDRQALLRKLFGTERFEDVQARFDERRRASEQALGARTAAVTARVEEAERLVTVEDLWGSGAPDAEAGDAASVAEETTAPALGMPSGASMTTTERIEALRRAAARAAYRAERRSAERDDAERTLALADAALVDLREQFVAQTERDRARSALAALEAEQPRIDEARRTLDRARTAEILRGVVDAVVRATTAESASAAVVDRARLAWRATGVDLDDESVVELQSWASDLTRESGHWQRAADLESSSSARRAQLDSARQAVDAAARHVERVDEERAELPALITRLTEERDTARRSADRLDGLTRLRDQATARRAAVREAERLKAEKAVAERERAAANRALATAQSVLAELLQRRLDGYAGELATTLTADEPCPVCGSAEHPAPAAHTDPISAEDVERAEAERDAATGRERRIVERLAALGAELAVAIAGADGRSDAQAEEELETASATLAEAATVAARVAALDDELNEATARGGVLERQHAEAASALATARESLAAREETEREATASIQAARGDAESVAARLEEARTRIAAASALASALNEHAQRIAALAEADAALGAALEKSAFDDVSEVAVALRSPAEQAALEQSVTTHTVQREKEKGVLLPLEMRALPEDRIDIAPAEEAAAAARSRWISAMEAAERAGATVERLKDLIESAAAEHAASAGQAADHEILQNLADTLAGRGANTRKMTLETFVLAAELEEIVRAANQRLNDMSTGRYQLQHSDALAARGAASGLGIVVFDAFTGQTRPAQSLSGGETFLSSLALALGLAEVVTARAGGIRLDTLFIDEGFGSLDGDTLDIAMRTLDELRQGGRTVGVISHVEAMQEQIPAQLTVRALANGPSVIETR